jgi:hypothetical protein
VSHYTAEELKALEMYDTFVITRYAIGDCIYRQVDYSPMLTSVFIKTHLDKRFRNIKDFFGEDAKVEAQRFCLDRVNN